MTYKESGMAISADPKEIWQPEDDEAYAKLRYVRAVDFVIVKKSKLIFAEFKSTAPLNSQDKNDYLTEICEKYLHSGLFFLSRTVKRISGPDLPELVAGVPMGSARVLFVLCVRDIPIEHARTLTDELQLRLRGAQNALGGQVDVVVINEVTGKRRGWLV